MDIISNIHNNLKKYSIGDRFKFPASQIYISSSLKHFSRIKKIYGLTDYNNINTPCIFFGIYNSHDISAIKVHRGDKYILWGGTDCDIRQQNRKKNIILVSKIITNAMHYATSIDIYERLKIMGINSQIIEINLVDTTIFKYNEKLGKKIFIYNGYSKNKSNEVIYNREIYEEVVKNLTEYDYIYSSSLEIPYEKMPDIYRECFVGLRLTDGDGNANIVQEMAIMGIPVFHNSNQVNAIKWKSASDIINIIRSYNTQSKSSINQDDTVINKSIFCSNYSVSSHNNVLIYFEKDLNIIDGAYNWLYTFSKFLSLQYDVTIACIYQSVTDTKRLIFDKIKFVSCHNVNYTHYKRVFYRPMDTLIDFYNNNIELIIHDFNEKDIQYYKKFAHIYVQNHIMKNIMQMNKIYNVNVLPTLVEVKYEALRNNDNITFIYCGTLKKDYMILEFLEIVDKLFLKYNFRMIVCGKYHNMNVQYDNKVKELITKLENNKNFLYISPCEKSKALEYIRKSEYGICLHGNNINPHRDSTKLIDYISNNCKPIAPFTALNCKYNIISYKSIDEIEKIMTNIITKKTVYDNKNNYDHTFENNMHMIDNITKIIVTTDIINNINDTIITNNIQNKLYINKSIFIDADNATFNDYAEIISKLYYGKKLDNDDMYIVHGKPKLYIYDRRRENFYNKMNITDYFEIVYDNVIYDMGKHSMIQNNVIDGILTLYNDMIYMVNINAKSYKFRLYDNDNDYEYDNTSIILHSLKSGEYHFELIYDNIKSFTIDEYINVNYYVDMIYLLYKNNNNLYKNIRLLDDFYINKFKSIKMEQNIINPMKNIIEDAIIKQYNKIMVINHEIAIHKDFIKIFDMATRNCYYKAMMLGVTQYSWININKSNIVYRANDHTYGTTANIYHISCYDELYKNINNNTNINNIVNTITKERYSYVINPNIIIPNIENNEKYNMMGSRISTVKNRFKWDNVYINNKKYLYSWNIEKKVNNNNPIFLIGVCVNDLDYIINVINKSDSTYAFIIIGNTINISKLKTIKYPKNISYYLVNSDTDDINIMNNIIMEISKDIKYEYGFIVNECVELSHNVIMKYYNVYNKYNIPFLILQKCNHNKTSNDDLVSYEHIDKIVMFTFNKPMIDNVGYIDVCIPRKDITIEYVTRCCEYGYNNINFLFGVNME